MDEEQLTHSESQNMEVNTDYMKEQIKQRPINRRRLLRRTLITGFLAVLFGAVACFVFLFLEPYFSNMLNPVPPAEPISFPEETVVEEMSPEEMLADDEQIVTEAENAAAEAAAEATAAKLEAQIREQLEAQAASQQIDPADLERQVREVMQQQTDNIATYEKTYETLSLLAQDLSTSMVSVSSVTSDTDWFNDPYESRGTTAGLIVAETESELLILSKDSSLRDAERIQITLSDGSSWPSEIRQMDEVSGLQILTLSKEALPEEESGAYSVAELGSSIQANLIGNPVIVMGAPAGTVGGVNFGMITGIVQT
ncbi:MAG: serine protease, partial [Lachnospiraceae bacterium]|nr:serine protease [Lachnospiraceae bacterium]